MVLISLMGGLLVLLGFLIGATVEPNVGGLFGIAGALGLWLILLALAFLQGDKILLFSSNAHPIQKEDAPQLWNLVEEMTIASGLGTMPKVYIIEDSNPNAFAVGRKPENAAVAVTSGLMKQLNRDELQGVIAHEIGHIKNMDIRFMTLAAVMVGTIVILSDTFLRSLWYGAMFRGRSRNRKSGGQEQILFLLIAIVVAVLAPIIANMLYLACSRKREYLADASGAQFTRYPEGLASALEKISRRSLPKKKEINRAITPMYIINPLQARSFTSLFSTHPPTEKRIQILRSMSGAGFLDYENAYKQVHGQSSHCLGQRTLKESESIEKREVTPEKPTKDSAVQRAEFVNDLLTNFGGYAMIPCACGIRFKIPPEFHKTMIPCPSCGKQHSNPHKQGNEPPDPNTPLRYQRKGEGWETVECACGKKIQLSPKFSGTHLKCTDCNREIKIIS